MSVRSVGGRLDCAVLAQLDRPTDSEITKETRGLAAQGLKGADIGVALRLDPAVVPSLVREPQRPFYALSKFDGPNGTMARNACNKSPATQRIARVRFGGKLVDE